MAFIKADKIELKENSLFFESEKTGLRYIDGIDVDRLLAPIFDVHGLPSPNNAVRYGGWERKAGANWFASPETFTLAGHSLGHYMSAIAKFYEVTGNIKLLTKINYIVSQLDLLQRVTGSGYIGGCEESCFLRLFGGDVENWCDGFWVPWYNVHKIYKGLIDIYEVCKSEAALNVLIRFADWACNGLSGLDGIKVEKMLETEYGGMNEVFANLYEITGDKKYLEAAVRFTQQGLLSMLLSNNDGLAGLHANTQIPKVIGMAAIYRAAEEKYPEYRTAAENFWNMVVNSHSYVIGGNSVGEHFEAPDRETLTNKTCESCNSYNMQRLSKYLYSFSTNPEYFDWYETALYNHILPQQERKTGAKMYFVSLLPGHHRTYESKYNSWWCCTGTGMENPARYRQAMLYENDGELFVNLYIPSRFKSEAAGIEAEITTDYPCSHSLSFRILKAVKSSVIHFRIPSFCDSAKVCINGRLFRECGGGYVSLEREWSRGDVVEIEFDFRLKTYISRSDGNVAFRYGPLVLAARLGKLMPEVSEYIDDELKVDSICVPAPELIAGSNSPETLLKQKNGFAHFVLPEECNSLGRDVELVPFSEILHEHYSVYFKLSH